MGVLLLAAAGCATSPDHAAGLHEDYNGAEVPFDVVVQPADGRILVQLRPGHCRQIATSPPGPPRVVQQYRCRYSTADVPLGLTIPDYPPFTTVTNMAGSATFYVDDDSALALVHEVATIYVGDRVVAQVALSPLARTAASRRTPPPPPPPPLYEPLPPPPMAPPPAFVPEPPVVAQAPQTRPWRPEELFALALGACAVKVWSLNQCEENLGAALCSAGAQWLQKGTVDGWTVAEDVVKAQLSKESDVAKVLLAAGDFLECFIGIEPRLVQANRSGLLPPLTR